ncbi:hypothetical protein NVP2275O_215 [Vibrio phage 2.275.O._10N.286.54.E11]|nr:hypothetical protein NVP2275O_215 [Vibrio phage 2.275.O._10N.286.54.E11]
MVYLCYISKGMSVKEVSEMLGYDKHNPIKQEIYQQLIDGAKFKKWDTEARSKKGAKGSMRFVKLIDINSDDVESWLFTLGLEDSTFFPLGVIDVTGEELVNERDDELSNIHWSIQPELSKMVVEYYTKYPKTEIVYRGGWNRDIDYSLRNRLSAHYNTRYREEETKIKKKYANTITQYMKKFDL